MEQEDLRAAYARWINDEDNTAHTAAGSWSWSQDQLKQYYEAKQERNGVWLGIRRCEDDALVGTCSIYDVNWIHGTAKRGILIGKKFWGQGYATEAINLLSHIAFDKLNLRKLKSTTVAGNAGIERVNERSGYTREGLARQEFLRSGKAHDVVSWGLLAEEWRQDG
jgi:RimJ/RimL family protein N-acetyltransferase